MTASYPCTRIGVALSAMNQDLHWGSYAAPDDTKHVGYHIARQDVRLKRSRQTCGHPQTHAHTHRPYMCCSADMHALLSG